MNYYQHLMGIAAVSLLALSLCACHSEQDEEELIEQPYSQSDEVTTYRMHFHATVADYDGTTTRATGYQWATGAKLYLTFKVATQTVTGTAVYQGGDLWTTPSSSLPETDDGQCTVAFFVDEQKATASTITLGHHTRAYFDAVATYEQAEDVLSVVGTLTPVTGRVRFAAAAGRQAVVSGLKFNTAFDIGSNEFRTTTENVTVTVGADGLSPYYYAAFAGDERQLTVTIDAQTAWRRAFAANVLQQGQSGRITLPTEASHAGWTLINTDNNQPITLPVIKEKPQTSGLSFKSVSLTASVSETGNGRLKEVGFVYGTSHNPTLDGSKLSCGQATAISGRITGLQPETTYYVRAYARNEAGTAYSAETEFTTKKKPDDTSFDIDDFDDDDDVWDNQ